jgi:predicted nucleic acid-binding protein
MGTIASTIAVLQGHKVYFDTNIFVYVLGDNKEFLARSFPFFQAVEAGRITGVSGDLVIAELLVKPMMNNDMIAIERTEALFDSEDGYFQALPHDRATLRLAAHIRATQKLSMIDAVHVATAIKAGCSNFITNDERIAERAKGIEVIRLSSLPPRFNKAITHNRDVRGSTG